MQLTGFDFEEATDFLIQEFKKVEKQKKPTTFHSIRVGSLLFHHGLPEEICIAGLLHGSIEDTHITKEIIKQKYGMTVAEIVWASTENTSLPKDKQKEEVVRNSSNHSEEALIVKLADVYDNFVFYRRQNNIEQINRCKTFAKLIQQHKKESYTHEIFRLNDKILNFSQLVNRGF